jgi:DNA-binding MarR family transcriptional regulator
MTKFDIIKDLVALIDDYDKSNQDDLSTESFLFWLNEKKMLLGKSSEPNSAENTNNEMSEWRISYYVWLMSKYAKTYVKKALQGLPLVGLDDFGYLITLCFEGDKNKTELIQQNINEVSSGMEIIKRLEKKGLIKSYQDANDRRATQLTATSKGHEVLRTAMQEMFKATNIVAGNLNDEERLNLLTILNKLHTFHNPIFLNESKTELEEIQEKYLN